MSDRKQLADTDQVAEFLDLPPRTLVQWRHRGVGPPSISVGRHVRYRWEDVDRWLDQQRSRHEQPQTTSDAEGGARSMTDIDAVEAMARDVFGCEADKETVLQVFRKFRECGYRLTPRTSKMMVVDHRGVQLVVDPNVGDGEVVAECGDGHGPMVAAALDRSQGAR